MDIKQALIEHKLWLDNPKGGCQLCCSNADLRNANLQDADLQGALLPENFEDSITAQHLSIVPSEGAFIGWKKANGFLVKLRILASAQRCNATGRKCRASKVRVLEVWCGNTKMGEEFQGAFTQVHGPKTYYIVGDIVVPDKWDPCRWNECSNGIHFFMTRKEAEEW